MGFYKCCGATEGAVHYLTCPDRIPTKDELFVRAVDLLEDLKSEGGFVAELAGSLMGCICSDTSVGELKGIIDICTRRLAAKQ